MRAVAKYDIKQDDSYHGIFGFFLKAFQAQARINHGMWTSTGVFIRAKVNRAMSLYVLSILYQPPFRLERNI